MPQVIAASRGRFLKFTLPPERDLTNPGSYSPGCRGFIFSSTTLTIHGKDLGGIIARCRVMRVQLLLPDMAIP